MKQAATIVFKTDLVAAYNAANSEKIRTTVNWTPALTAGAGVLK
ncbi:hypothetical protein [Streptomyces incarnatus]|nr:hypothetical protein [Streptomyces incarnatus]